MTAVKERAVLEFAILGPLEVRTDGVLLPIGGFRQRALLAMLLLHANEVVSSDRLIEELWGGEPRTDTAVLRVRVSQLRKAFEQAGASGPIETRAPGYLVALDPGRLDLDRFERLSDDAAAVVHDDPAAAASGLRSALALWRGPPLAEFAYEPFAQTAIGRLEELRLTTLERRVDADLALGLDRELVGELHALVAENPLREHFCGQLMLALYRAGRQAEALDVFHEKRRVLVEELGLEPGPALQDLQRRILAHEAGPARPFQAATETPLRGPAGGGESRKTVTVVACDLVETSTAGSGTDAEVFRRVHTRALERAADVLARHGGTVERFVGDAFGAVFGVPIAHEDDTLRAARAAVELRTVLEALNVELEAEWGVRLAARVGVETGEVLVEDEAAVASVTGQAVQTAARLQQTADGGEIVLGETAWSLLRSAVTAEPFAGNRDDGAGWRLVDLDDSAPPIPRRFDTPFFGRTAELGRLRAAYERATRDRTTCLVTVLGEAGIGKSRLAAEARLDLLAEARVLVGRCLPYGEGVTYVALREILRQALGDDPAETLPSLLTGDPDGDRVAQAVGTLLGLVPGSVALEEGFWGVRRLCEALGRPRPLVLVFEDVHWAEPAMLDLLEYVAGNAVDTPLLLLCLARHELLEHHPGWGGRVRAESIELRPLTQRQSELLATWLISDRGAAGAPDEVVEAAQGNPLFVEQLIAMIADGGWRPGERRLPATIEALLAARLELLGPAARLVLERASVLGDRFDPGALAHVVPEEVQATLPSHLRALVHNRLLGRTRSTAGGEGYRFRHVLVREAAYRRLPKEQRADLHESVAEQLAAEPRAAAAAGGQDELIGFHFERAYAYRLQLGREDAHARRLAEQASTHLAAAAAQAFARTDFRAVDQLLARATPLLAVEDPRRASLLYDRGTSLLTLGRSVEADAVLVEAIQAARATGDDRIEWRARLDRAAVSGPGLLARARLAHDGVRELGALGDDRGLVRAWRLAGSVARDRGRATLMEEAGKHMLLHAQRCGVYREVAWATWLFADAILIGPTPAADGIAECERLILRREELRVGDIGPLGTIALLLAMRGDFDRARQLLTPARELLEGLGHKRPLLTTLCWRGELELVAGDWAAADETLSEAATLAGGESHVAADTAALHARAALALGRIDEAEDLARLAREAASPESRLDQTVWRSVSAAVLTARGSAADAVELASEAARLLRNTDLLSLRADVNLDLAAALHACGDTERATAAIRQAGILYELKGNTVGARRVREAATPSATRA